MSKINDVIDSIPLSSFKRELNATIRESLILANKGNKEIDVSIKLNIRVDEVENEDDNSYFKAPVIDYKVTRKIKESKFDFTGELPHSIIAIENGEVLLKLANKANINQLSFFEEDL